MYNKKSSKCFVCFLLLLMHFPNTLFLLFFILLKISNTMALRDILGLIFSIGVVAAMWWGCSFEMEQLMMGELVKAAGGKYKFLTILNMVKFENRTIDIVDASIDLMISFYF